jgi:pimeloyl-ACP methyl ester carboxylesterase
MPTVYRRGERIAGLKGEVRGGLAVVAHSPFDINALNELVERSAGLPGDPLANVYRVLASAGPSFEAWANAYVSRNRGDRYVGSLDLEGGDERILALKQSLDLAGELWSAQGKDIDQLALALIVPRPGRRATLDCDRPAFVLDHGSIRARVLSAGGRLREFGVVLFPAARSKRRGRLVDALRDRATGRVLPRLDEVRSQDLVGKSGVVIFLHGLMSTDVGTFEEVLKALEQEPAFRDSAYLVSWPHDTLTSIDVNAQNLAELIDKRFGKSNLPVTFICHSRGGLVARRTAVELMEIDKKAWKRRLRGCVTFGTPHNGAELAENANELIGKLLLIRAMAKQAGLVPLVDALLAVKGKKALDGIADLCPGSEKDAFLRKLKHSEWRLAKKIGAVPVPLFAVGGKANSTGLADRLSRRYFNGAANDLIVPYASATPDAAEHTAEMVCNHFEYFTADALRAPATTNAIAFLRTALFGQAQADAEAGESSLTMRPLVVKTRVKAVQET